MSTVVAKKQLDEPVTTAVLRHAVERGEQRRRLVLQARTVRYLPDSRSLLIGFADDSAVVLPVKNYPELAKLKRAQLDNLELGFAGSALCLEEKDLHVSIAGLVSASAPLMAMAATMVATRNGSRRTIAKSAASRENGQKGGRPRKAVAAD
jgi:Protein of unknown function (DUF2442)